MDKLLLSLCFIYNTYRIDCDFTYILYLTPCLSKHFSATDKVVYTSPVVHLGPCHSCIVYFYDRVDLFDNIILSEDK